MKKKIKTSHVLNAHIDSVWSNISKASGVNEWLPIVETCSLEGQGEGAKRKCTTENGFLNETIVKVDHDSKTFQYAIDEQNLFPITDILGTMALREENGETVLDWNLEFSLEDENVLPMIKEGVGGLYQAGAQGLESISK